jgi:hypothetical protein
MMFSRMSGVELYVVKNSPLLSVTVYVWRTDSRCAPAGLNFRRHSGRRTDARFTRPFFTKLRRCSQQGEQSPFLHCCCPFLHRDHIIIPCCLLLLWLWMICDFFSSSCFYVTRAHWTDVSLMSQVVSTSLVLTELTSHLHYKLFLHHLCSLNWHQTDVT